MGERLTVHSHGHLDHQAFVYAGRDEFVATLAPWLLEGLEQGERLFAATSRSNIDALQDALGDAAAAVEFHDAADWYRQPYRTLDAYAAYVEEHGREGRVRVIGEPVWEGRSDASMREWTRYESVINAAFAEMPVSIVCPYDERVLPERIIEDASRTHPEILSRDGLRRSDAYVPPRELLAALMDETDRPPPDAAHLKVEDADLRRVRRFVAAVGEAAGLPPDRRDEAVLVANELATNAVRYGSFPVAVRGWREDGVFVCEVEDAGRGFDDPLTGCSRPPVSRPGGRGVWLVRQLSESVDVLRRPGRFVVRARLSADAGA